MPEEKSPGHEGFFMGDLVRHASAATNTALAWKKCVDEMAITNGGVRLGHSRYSWEGVVEQFFREIHRLNFSPAETQKIDERFDILLTFVSNRVLQSGHMYSQEQLEQVGEFIAVAAVCGIQDAIIVDPQRTDLVYDLLPQDWTTAAGIPPKNFDDLYFKATGKQRTPRMSS